MKIINYYFYDINAKMKYFCLCDNASFMNSVIINKIFFSVLLVILYIYLQGFILKIIVKKENYMSGRKFIDKCLKTQFINKYNFLKKTPILTAIIPAYNCEKTIIYPIISIQNQNISNFEIILIDDFSQDNTSKILQIFKKQDKRIKVINNKRNMGTLYSRCIATLVSNGEYIFALDNDDMVFEEDIFYFTYKIAKEHNYDIVGFKAVSVKKYSDSITKMKDLEKYKHKNNLIILQPELSTWIISYKGKFKPHDVTLWGKIIKSKIYIESINLLGENRFSTYMSWAEDTSMNFIIFTIAQSFIFINKYGILHLISPLTASSLQPINNKFFGSIFLLDIIHEFSKIKENKIFSVFAALDIMHSFYKYKSILNKKNLSYFRSIIFRIINSKDINYKNKNFVIKEFQKFSFNMR